MGKFASMIKKHTRNQLIVFSVYQYQKIDMMGKYENGLKKPEVLKK